MPRAQGASSHPTPKAYPAQGSAHLFRWLTAGSFAFWFVALVGLVIAQTLQWFEVRAFYWVAFLIAALSSIGSLFFLARSQKESPSTKPPNDVGKTSDPQALSGMQVVLMYVLAAYLLGLVGLNIAQKEGILRVEAGTWVVISTILGAAAALAVYLGILRKKRTP